MMWRTWLSVDPQTRPTHECMLPDWLLLILLFVGIAIVPMVDQARMMTPFEYLAGGLGTLFQSVGAFVGLILLAITLIVGGAMLLAGAEHVKSFVGSKRRSVTADSRAGATAIDTGASDDTTADSKHHMRPYRVAKATGVPRDDRLYGLVFVIAGLLLLWIIPSYMFKDKTAQPYQPPPSYANTPSYSRKFSLSDSAPSQAVLGVMTLGVLLAVFAFLAPEKETKKIGEALQRKKKTK